jgi:hypothetical protein
VIALKRKSWTIVGVTAIEGISSPISIASMRGPRERA